MWHRKIQVTLPSANMRSSTRLSHLTAHGTRTYTFSRKKAQSVKQN